MSDVAPVAQLDRASGFEPGGCGFKSCQGYQKNNRASSSAVEQLPLKQLVVGSNPSWPSILRIPLYHFMKKIIVFGSFDPLHDGHRSYFRQAKSLGDFLTVVVARDENIKKLKNREVKLMESERLKTVKLEKDVDKAILGDKNSEYLVLEREKPDIIAVGYDQVIPKDLKNMVKKYKVITLKPYKPEIYKSSKLG